MADKIKLGEISKNLKITNKDIIAKLAEFGVELKSSASVVDEETIGLIFDIYTEMNQVSDEEIREMREAALKKASEDGNDEEKPAKKPAKKTEEKAEKPAKKEEKKAEEKSVKEVKKTEEKVDKSQLEALLAIADKITEDILSNLDADLVKEFKTALQAAQDIYTGNDVTQAQVNAAITRLNVAIENLNIRDFNKIKLQELVERTEKLSAKDYTRASWERLEKALSAAKIVLADEKATLAAVDEAKTVLQNALEQLEKVAISEESSQGVKTGDAANFAGIFALMVSTASLVLWMKRRKENN